MRCNECGFENPATHNYCGYCGQRLSAPVMANPLRPVRGKEAAPARPQPPREPATLSGPSFLGLSGRGAGNYDYLLEEDEPSYRGVAITLLALAVLAVVCVAYWQPIRDFVLANASGYLQIAAPPQASLPPPPSIQANQTASQPIPTGEQTGPEASGGAPAAETPAKGEAALPGNGPEDSGASASAGKSQAQPPAEESRALGDQRSPKGEGATEANHAAAEPSPKSGSGSRAAAESRATDPLLAAGEKYLYGRGVPRNCAQAVAYLRAAAEQDDPRALSRLGALYSVGECVPQDRVAAYSWFSRAHTADPGNPYLERNLNILWRDMNANERRRVMGGSR